MTVNKAEGQTFDWTYGLFAHMIAERQASIEGRLYFEAKQRCQNHPPNIEALAER